MQKASIGLDEEKADAEKHLKKLLNKLRHAHHGHGRAWCHKARKLLKKISSWLGKGDKACKHKSASEGGVLASVGFEGDVKLWTESEDGMWAEKGCIKGMCLVYACRY